MTEPDLNPWKDDDSKPPSPATIQPAPVTTTDPALTESVFNHADINHHDIPANELLTEFDPLASPEEQAARDAWETSEGHLPQPPAPPPKEDTSAAPNAPPPFLSSILPSSLSVSPPSRSSSPFPTFASIAKTLSSLPNLSRTRPMSMDAATPVTAQAISNVAPQDSAEGSGTQREESNTDDGDTDANARPTSPNQEEREEQEARELELQFDFQKFLDQMKTRSAEPVSKYLRSFLNTFAKRPVPVNEQVRIIGDFLTFIAAHMRNCEVWKSVSDAEFDNVLEGMEKLVMNRLYDLTFTPQVIRANPSRPYNPDDLERDRVLAQRILLFGWVEEEHLDVPVGEGSQGFIMFAQQELLKINHYKAPRDKLICILNCCKVIFGLIRHLKKEEGADSFVPILIFVVLKANPPHLMSNVEFINRYRNPAKLQGEAGYYLSSLIGAISFIETMDHTSLSSITREEFEYNVEAAIQALPSSNPQSPIIGRYDQTAYLAAIDREAAPSPHAGEESAQPLALSSPTPVNSIGEDARRLLQKTGDTISKPLNAIGRIFSEALDEAENKLAYLPGPFAPFEQHREAVDSQPQDSRLSHPQTPSNTTGPLIQTPYKARVRKVSSPYSLPSAPQASPFSPSPGAMPASLEGTFPPFIHSPTPHGPQGGYPHPFPEQYMYQGQQPPPLPPRTARDSFGQPFVPPEEEEGSGRLGPSDPGSYASLTPTPALDLSGVQAEIERIDVAHANAAAAARETLTQIFPGTDREVIDWVLEANSGDLGKSIEALLEMSSDQ